MIGSEIVFVHAAVNSTLFFSLVLVLLEHVILKMLPWQLLRLKSSSSTEVTQQKQSRCKVRILPFLACTAHLDSDLEGLSQLATLVGQSQVKQFQHIWTLESQRTRTK